MTTRPQVAFIGLGVMGFPMAGHLQRAGHPVCVYNRSPDKARHWCERFQGRSAASPAEAAEGAAIVFSCVGKDEDVREVLVGEHGVWRGLSPGAVVVDHTTTSAALAREMSECFAERGHGFIDAPISGGQAGAERGGLTVMCGGRDQDFQRVAPVLAAYSARARLMGGAGAGQLTKMVNQVCIAGLLQGLAEGLHFARAAGLDIESVVEVIAAGAAQSWQMDNRHRSMAAGEYEHGFAVEWMRKDLAYVLQAARENGSHLPVTALVDQFYSEVESLGGRRWDTSSLFARLEAMRQDGEK